MIMKIILLSSLFICGVSSSEEVGDKVLADEATAQDLENYSRLRGLLDETRSFRSVSIHGNLQVFSERTSDPAGFRTFSISNPGIFDAATEDLTTRFDSGRLLEKIEESRLSNQN